MQGGPPAPLTGAMLLQGTACQSKTQKKEVPVVQSLQTWKVSWRPFVNWSNRFDILFAVECGYLCCWKQWVATCLMSALLGTTIEGVWWGNQWSGCILCCVVKLHHDGFEADWHIFCQWKAKALERIALEPIVESSFFFQNYSCHFDNWCIELYFHVCIRTVHYDGYVTRIYCLLFR